MPPESMGRQKVSRQRRAKQEMFWNQGVVGPKDGVEGPKGGAGRIPLSGGLKRVNKCPSTKVFPFFYNSPLVGTGKQTSSSE